MRFAIRFLGAAGVLLGTCVFAFSQDLGSANKLFGKPAGRKETQAKPATKKEPPVAKAPAGRDHTKKKPQPVAGKKPVEKKAVEKKPAPTATATKRREITTPTGTTVTTPVAKPETTAATKPYDKNRFAPGRNPKSEPSKIEPPRKLTGDEEAGFEQLIREGNNARDVRRYSEAEAAYKRAAVIQPRDARAQYGLGNIYADQQRWDEAEKAYRAALQIEPTSANTRIALSYVLSQPIAVADLGDRYEEAEKLARRATEISPRSALAFDQLGATLESRGFIGAETERAYRRAIENDSSFAPAYAHLGRLLRRRGDNAGAAEAYRQAGDRATDVGTLILIAEILQSEQRYADSEPIVRRAIDMDRNDPAAYIMLGRAMTVAGKFKEAETALQRGVMLSPVAYTPNTMLASLYMRQGALEFAENALLQALRSVPAYEKRSLANEFVKLADAYRRAGKTTQAQRAFAQADRIDPDVAGMSGRFSSPQRN